MTDKSDSLHLVDVADDQRGEEDLRERSRHRVHRGDHRGVHEVDGVPVEEEPSRAEGGRDNEAPEHHPEY